MKNQFVLILAFLMISVSGLEAHAIHDPEKIELAQFKGGPAALQQYVTKHLIYPDCARQSALEGSVTVSFFVLADGAICNPKVEQSLSEACDLAALQLIENMPGWQPANKNGEAMHSRIKMKIWFSLEE